MSSNDRKKQEYSSVENDRVRAFLTENYKKMKELYFESYKYLETLKQKNNINRRDELFLSEFCNLHSFIFGKIGSFENLLTYDIDNNPAECLRMCLSYFFRFHLFVSNMSSNKPTEKRDLIFFPVINLNLKIFSVYENAENSKQCEGLLGRTLDNWTKRLIYGVVEYASEDGRNVALAMQMAFYIHIQNFGYMNVKLPKNKEEMIEFIQFAVDNVGKTRFASNEQIHQSPLRDDMSFSLKKALDTIEGVKYTTEEWDENGLESCKKELREHFFPYASENARTIDKKNFEQGLKFNPQRDPPAFGIAQEEVSRVEKLLINNENQEESTSEGLLKTDTKNRALVDTGKSKCQILPINDRQAAEQNEINISEKRDEDDSSSDAIKENTPKKIEIGMQCAQDISASAKSADEYLILPEKQKIQQPLVLPNTNEQNEKSDAVKTANIAESNGQKNDIQRNKPTAELDRKGYKFGESLIRQDKIGISGEQDKKDINYDLTPTNMQESRQPLVLLSSSKQDEEGNTLESANVPESDSQKNDILQNELIVKVDKRNDKASKNAIGRSEVNISEKQNEEDSSSATVEKDTSGKVEVKSPQRRDISISSDDVDQNLAPVRTQELQRKSSLSKPTKENIWNNTFERAGIVEPYNEKNKAQLIELTTKATEKDNEAGNNAIEKELDNSSRQSVSGLLSQKKSTTENKTKELFQQADVKIRSSVIKSEKQRGKMKDLISENGEAKKRESVETVGSDTVEPANPSRVIVEETSSIVDKNKPRASSLGILGSLFSPIKKIICCAADGVKYLAENADKVVDYFCNSDNDETLLEINSKAKPISEESSSNKTKSEGCEKDNDKSGISDKATIECDIDSKETILQNISMENDELYDQNECESLNGKNENIDGMKDIAGPFIQETNVDSDKDSAGDVTCDVSAVEPSVNADKTNKNNSLNILRLQKANAELSRGRRQREGKQEEGNDFENEETLNEESNELKTMLLNGPAKFHTFPESTVNSVLSSSKNSAGCADGKPSVLLNDYENFSDFKDSSNKATDGCVMIEKAYPENSFGKNDDDTNDSPNEIGFPVPLESIGQKTQIEAAERTNQDRDKRFFDNTGETSNGTENKQKTLVQSEFDQDKSNVLEKRKEKRLQKVEYVAGSPSFIEQNLVGHKSDALEKNKEEQLQRNEHTTESRNESANSGGYFDTFMTGVKSIWGGAKRVTSSALETTKNIAYSFVKPFVNSSEEHSELRQNDSDTITTESESAKFVVKKHEVERGIVTEQTVNGKSESGQNVLFEQIVDDEAAITKDLIGNAVNTEEKLIDNITTVVKKSPDFLNGPPTEDKSNQVEQHSENVEHDNEDSKYDNTETEKTGNPIVNFFSNTYNGLKNTAVTFKDLIVSAVNVVSDFVSNNETNDIDAKDNDENSEQFEKLEKLENIDNAEKKGDESELPITEFKDDNLVPKIKEQERTKEVAAQLPREVNSPGILGYLGSKVGNLADSLMTAGEKIVGSLTTVVKKGIEILNGPPVENENNPVKLRSESVEYDDEDSKYDNTETEKTGNPIVNFFSNTYNGLKNAAVVLKEQVVGAANGISDFLFDSKTSREDTKNNDTNNGQIEELEELAGVDDIEEQGDKSELPITETANSKLISTNSSDDSESAPHENNLIKPFLEPKTNTGFQLEAQRPPEQQQKSAEDEDKNNTASDDVMKPILKTVKKELMEEKPEPSRLFSNRTTSKTSVRRNPMTCEEMVACYNRASSEEKTYSKVELVKGINRIKTSIGRLLIKPEYSESIDNLCRIILRALNEGNSQCCSIIKVLSQVNNYNSGSEDKNKVMCILEFLSTGEVARCANRTFIEKIILMIRRFFDFSDKAMTALEKIEETIEKCPVKCDKVECANPKTVGSASPVFPDKIKGEVSPSSAVRSK